ncbi:FAD/NAD(P)-binding domain-containing protein [Clavulina sp. PMI_390]|nr:FAD/NAD(P)-binding domain-containing protein [Clavulina sp. PMI_390]
MYLDDTKWIQGYYTFETPIAHGEGFMRLLHDPQVTDEVLSWKIFTFSLTLSSLKNHPEIARDLRPIGMEQHSRATARTWFETRAEAVEFPNGDPQVVIIGAGQAGLMTAARLKRLGVTALIVEKNARVGDNWRHRYKSLVLHDLIWTCHFPYLKFPDDWPVFIPKDKMVGWLESYANIMELNVWLESTVEPNSTVYDEASGTFTLKVRRGDGSVRELKTHHIVLATGQAGEPYVPSFKGLDDFQGVVMHSSSYKGDVSWTGKKAVVVGTGSSAHDICEDFHYSGVDVTMVQRRPTLVTNLEPAASILLKSMYSDVSPPMEDSDLAMVSLPIRVMRGIMQMLHGMILEFDKNTHEGLRKAGFLLEEGNNGGTIMKYLEKGGGFYLNVGCSELIIDGKVKLKSGQEISHFEKNGVRMADGTLLEADVVVLATGYTSMRETAKRIVGPTIADRTGEVWGLDEGGDPQGIWRRSGHPGFWYMGGNLILSRIFSQYLALQIKAIEEGIAQKM